MPAKNEDLVSINISAVSVRDEDEVSFHRINYRPDFSDEEYELVAIVARTSPSTYVLQKLLVKTFVLQKLPRLVKEITGQRWIVIPVGSEHKEIPDIERLWQLSDIYIASCRPRTPPSALNKQLENIRIGEILVFYTLKEWWKKNKHLGFSQALKEYRAYLTQYYGKIKELKEKGKNIDVRVGLVDAMKLIMAEKNLPEDNPRSWLEAARQMAKPAGTIYEEFPPLGPVGIIDDRFSAFITFHSYDVKTGNITYISVLIENNDNVVNQYLIWNSGVNDFLEDMEFIKSKLAEYGVFKKNYVYDLMPMLNFE